MGPSEVRVSPSFITLVIHQTTQWPDIHQQNGASVAPFPHLMTLNRDRTDKNGSFRQLLDVAVFRLKILNIAKCIVYCVVNFPLGWDTANEPV